MQPPVVRQPRRGTICFAALFALGAASASAAPIDFNGTTYNQDFQTMTGTAIATSVVTVSTMTELSTLSGAASITGWYMYGTGWSGSLNKWQGADSGASTAGGVRQLYDGSGARALGSIASSSYLGYFGLILKNTSGATIDTLSLSYDAVMNRNPSATTLTQESNLTALANKYALSYAVRANGAGNFTAMTNVTPLDFTTPTTGPGAPATVAGGSRAMSSVTTIGTRISGTLSASPLGWASGEYLYVAWYDGNDTGNDASAGIDNFSISVPVGLRDLTWGLIVDGAWDSVATHFTSGGSATAFAAADKVTFDNAAGGVIALSGALAPTTVTVSASSGTYTFNGATAADKITGGTGIVKSGAGILILTSANDFTGGVTITDGTVQIDGAGRLGSGPISLNGSGAALVSTSSSAVSMSANTLTVGASGGAIDTGANSLTLGALTTSGMLTKSGAGSLTVGMVTSNAGTGFTVSSGELVLGQTSGTVKIFANTILTGNLVLNGGIRFDVDGNSTISGTGKLKLAASGGLLSNTFADNGGTISAEIALNSSAIAFAKGSWNGETYTPSTTFSTTVGGTGSGGLILSLLSGDSDVDLSGSSLNGGGTGTLTLNGASTYTGNTTINAGTPAAAVSVVLGVSDALPTTTGLIVGTKTGLGVPVMDLNGKNQQLAYIADGANVSATKYLKFVNNASTPSVLTLGGSVSPGKAFSGTISDGIGTIALVKTGGNTQILSGTSDYSGGVTVSAGTLQVKAATPSTVSGALGAPTGAVVVNNSGQLFVSASIANAVTVNSGGRVSGNGELDLITVNSGGVIAANSSLTQLNAATLTANNTATMAGKSVIEWKLNDASAAAGIGYDTFNFTIGLDLSGASAANKIMVRIISFAAPGDLVAGNPLSINPGVSKTFDFASASSVTKPTFATNIADLFEFDVSQFRYSDGSTSSAGLWAMSFDQDTQIMTLTAVPEPSTYGLGLGALLLAAAAIRRRRRKA